MTTKTMWRLTDYDVIIKRIADEVEEGGNTPSEMAQMIKAELHAYENLVDAEKPYLISMYNVPQSFNNSDIIAIGEICYREEDYDEDIYYHIYPVSYIKNGEYFVEYKVLYTLPISDI